MRTFQLSLLSLLSLTLGLGLAACTDDSQPAGPEDSATETGEGGDGDGDASGDGDGDASGDGDGDASGDGDGDASGDGDGDEPLAECGNGVVEAGEECDDGDGMDDDECSNACMLPVCGDGITQEGEGEACDDGNTVSGDACTAACQLPGALILEQYIDVLDGQDDAGFEIVLDAAGNMTVLADVDGARWLAQFDAEGVPQWRHGIPPSTVPTLAIGPEGQLAVGGRFNGTQGFTRLYDGEGNSQWTSNVPGVPSDVLDVALDDAGRVYSTGYYDGDRALLRVHDGEGNELWAKQELAGGAYGPLAVSGEGLAWAVRMEPLAVQKWDASGSPLWTSDALPEGEYLDIIVDAEGLSYVLAEAADQSSVSISKLSAEGDLLWTVERDEPGQMDFAGGIALLPAGGVIFAGGVSTPEQSLDGIIAWYDADGVSMLPELQLDNLHPLVDLDIFFDIEVGEDYAVAIGASAPEGGDADLWMFKFEI